MNTMEETSKDKINMEETEEVLKDEGMDAVEGEAWQQEEVLEDKEFEELKDEENSSIFKNRSHKKEISKLNSEVKKLTSEVDTLKDRLLRLNAEYDNYRKRTVKEKEGIYSDAVLDVLKGMLPVLDNLERAAITEGCVEDIKTGIDLTIRQFYSAFEKIGVEEISTEEGFDPNFHEAVMHIEDPNLPKNSVAEVFQKGYKKGSKIIRHSIVKVAN